MVKRGGVVRRTCGAAERMALRSFAFFPPARHHHKNAQCQPAGEGRQNNQHQRRLPQGAKKEMHRKEREIKTFAAQVLELKRLADPLPRTQGQTHLSITETRHLRRPPALAW